MDETYWAWGLFVGAIALQLQHHAMVSPLAQAFANSGFGRDRLIVRLYGINLLASLSLLGWPFVAVARLYYNNDPSILSMFLYVVGAAAVGWAASIVLIVLASSIQKNRNVPELSPEAMEDSAHNMKVWVAISVGSLAAVVGAWWAVFAQDY